MAKDKVKKGRKKEKAAPIKIPGDPITLPAGMVPHLVNQRIFDYLPHFVAALKSMHDELVLIRKALED